MGEAEVIGARLRGNSVRDLAGTNRAAKAGRGAAASEAVFHTRIWDAWATRKRVEWNGSRNPRISELVRFLQKNCGECLRGGFCGGEVAWMARILGLIFRLP